LTGLLGCGLALVAMGSGAESVLHWSGLTLIAGASCWAAASLLKLRRQCRRVAEALETAGDAKIVEPAAVAEAAPDSLGHALGDALSAARRAAVDAELKARELELRLAIVDAERRHAESIISGMSDAVVVTDPYDDVVLANESAARALKFDLQGAAHTPVRKLVRDAKLIELIRETRQAGPRGGRQVVEHQLVEQGGSTKTYKVTLSPVVDSEPKAFSGVVAVMHDVTGEREITKLKSDFVSNVSHELRTPLASIKAYVELLIDGEARDEAAKREFYEVIQKEANRLGRMIDNVLTVSKIDAGLIKSERTPQGVNAIVGDAIDAILEKAQQKGITVRREFTRIDHGVFLDGDMMCQAVLNLLSNAVKYTLGGGEINVETAVDEVRKKVAVCVADTGVGIAPADLPFIFDKFFRAQSTRNMAHGLGLGLALVKHVVETVHGGRVFVDSAVGKGSTFTIELDLCGETNSSCSSRGANHE
jgi:signal transduction histidine kinase